MCCGRSSFFWLCSYWANCDPQNLIIPPCSPIWCYFSFISVAVERLRCVSASWVDLNEDNFVSAGIINTRTTLIRCLLRLQWNPSKTDTIGTNDCVRYSKGVLSSGLVVDHAPPIIAANYDKARRKRPYWWEFCRLTASRQELETFRLYCSS